MSKEQTLLTTGLYVWRYEICLVLKPLYIHKGEPTRWHDTSIGQQKETPGSKLSHQEMALSLDVLLATIYCPPPSAILQCVFFLLYSSERTLWSLSTLLFVFSVTADKFHCIYSQPDHRKRRIAYDNIFWQNMSVEFRWAFFTTTQIRVSFFAFKIHLPCLICRLMVDPHAVSPEPARSHGRWARVSLKKMAVTGKQDIE